MKTSHHYVTAINRTWSMKSKEAAHAKAAKLAKEFPGQGFSVVSCYTTRYAETPKGKKR
jgi:hypothetical protein